MEKITAQQIDKYLDDLPNHSELAEKIAEYVNKHPNYNLAQIAQIIDNFYNRSCGFGIADDIKCLF